MPIPHLDSPSISLWMPVSLLLQIPTAPNMMKSHGPGCRHLEERVGEQKSLASPKISLFASGLELPRKPAESDRVSLKRQAGWAGQGWADPSPVGGGIPGGGLKQRHWRGPDTEKAIDMAGTSLGARFYRQIKRHPGVSSVLKAWDSNFPLTHPQVP